MTCILFTKTHVYTDTLHLDDGGEAFHSLTKIKKLKEPLRVKWTNLESEPISDSSNAASFVDIIHGYTCTGNNLVADRLIDHVIAGAIAVLDEKAIKVKSGEMVKAMEEHQLSVDLNSIRSVYRIIVQGAFVNAITEATVILIGEKACYSIDIGTKRVTVGKIPRDNPTTYGSGGSYASKVYYTTNDPLRAMYTALWYNHEMTGGMIDIWNLPTPEEPHLYRTGVCNQRSLYEIKELLAQPVDPQNPMTADLISSDAIAKKIITVAQTAMEMGYIRGQKSLQSHRKGRGEKDPAGAGDSKLRVKFNGVTEEATMPGRPSRSKSTRKSRKSK